MHINFIKLKQKARRYAMQALYTWNISTNSIDSVEAYYMQDRNPNKFNAEYFSTILHGVAANITKLDECISKESNRLIKEINIIELMILRVATYELLHCLEVPYKVVINEALELVKMFGSEDSYKFINSILDKIKQQRITL